MRKEIKIALIVATSVLLIALAGFIAWGLTPLGPTDEALAAMESDAVVTVVDHGDFVTFTPTDRKSVV